MQRQKREFYLSTQDELQKHSFFEAGVFDALCYLCEHSIRDNISERGRAKYGNLSGLHYPVHAR